MHRWHSHRWQGIAVVMLTSLFPLWLLPALSNAAHAAPSGAPDRPSSVPSSPPNISFPRQSYMGPPHGEGTSRGEDSEQPRHRLWFHDGAWWALMVDIQDRAVRVHELMPDHTWRPTEAVVSTDPGSVGESLPAGDRLFVLADGTDGVALVSRLTYDAAARVYRTDPGFPEPVTRRLTPGAALTIDAEGRLWAAWTADERVWLSRSDPEGRDWSRPFSPTMDGLTAPARKMATVAAVQDAVAVMWSDQDHQFRFAVHRLGDPPDVWTLETPLRDLGTADEQLSPTVVPGDSGDTLVAAVRTSQKEGGPAPDAPSIMVLARRPDGSWATSVASTVADRVTRPVVLVDTGLQRVHLFLQGSNDGTIFHKRAHLADLSFAEGRGERWIGGPDAVLADPVSTRQTVNARTGLVLLASETVTGRYWHGEQSLPVPEGGVPGLADDEPPSPPERLEAKPSSGAVDLWWSPAWDGSGWAPAGTRPPVAGYAVLRDGAQLGVTSQQFFTDSFPLPGVKHRYDVSALDLVGNRSQPVSAVAQVTPSSTPPPSLWWALGAVVAAAAVLVGLQRRHVRHHLS